jgi:hypothetical protein
VDAFGLGTGEALGLWEGERLGEPLGERRGEGRGNSWSSSSSTMGGALLGNDGLASSEPYDPAEATDEDDPPRSWPPVSAVVFAHGPFKSPLMKSTDLRRWSTSSTVMASMSVKLFGATASGRWPAVTAAAAAVRAEQRVDVLPSVTRLTNEDAAGVASKLVLRLLRAPRENFSCHDSPSLRHSSVT